VQQVQKIRPADFVDVMGWKAVGNKLVDKKQVEMAWERKHDHPEQPELF
jgi:topoisomerase-4 subunit A